MIMFTGSAVLIQCTRVTDGRTDGQTDGIAVMAYTRSSIMLSRVKTDEKESLNEVKVRNIWYHVPRRDRDQRESGVNVIPIPDRS